MLVYEKDGKNILLSGEPGCIVEFPKSVKKLAANSEEHKIIVEIIDRISHCIESPCGIHRHHLSAADGDKLVSQVKLGAAIASSIVRVDSLPQRFLYHLLSIFVHALKKVARVLIVLRALSIPAHVLDLTENNHFTK